MRPERRGAGDPHLGAAIADSNMEAVSAFLGGSAVTVRSANQKASPVTPTSEQIAAEISALINSKPRSPTIAEISAIITRATPSVAEADDALMRYRQTWRGLSLKAEQCVRKSDKYPGHHMLKADAVAAVAALEAFEDRFLLDPDAAHKARTLIDLYLLSQVTLRITCPNRRNGYPGDRLSTAVFVLSRAIEICVRRQHAGDEHETNRALGIGKVGRASWLARHGK